MNLDLTGRVALVTGAASGMGRATAALLAAEGARVVAADIDADGPAATAAALRAAGGAAAAVAGNVSRRTDAERYVGAALEAFGRLDVLVNNAGVEGFQTLVDTNDELWERMFATNARGPYLATQYAVAEIARAGGGAIVNVASAAALRGNAGLAAYSAARAALVSMTRCLAVELAPMGIRVNAVAPGLIDTPMARRWIDGIGGPEAVFALVGHAMPIRRLGQPDEVARVIAFLASPAASYLNGVVVPIDSGMTA